VRFEPAWQDVTIRLIAQRGVFHGKAPSSATRQWTIRGYFGSHDEHGRSRRERKGTRRPSLGTPVATSSELYLEDELAHTRVSLPPPFSGRKYHLFCSEYNSGALALAEELKESDVFVNMGKKTSAVLTHTSDVDKLAQCDHSSKLCNQPSTAPVQHLTRVCLSV
jgi:hypothetical protein